MCGSGEMGATIQEWAVAAHMGELTLRGKATIPWGPV